MNEEYLNTLQPDELVRALVNCSYNVIASKGFAVYGGDTREQIVNDYNTIYNYIVTKLEK